MGEEELGASKAPGCGHSTMTQTVPVSGGGNTRHRHEGRGEQHSKTKVKMMGKRDRRRNPRAASVIVPAITREPTLSRPA